MHVLTASETLPPTEKLFHGDAYLREWNATVLHVQDDLVILDSTIFYAESGGQVGDRGFIDDVPVVDVQKNPGLPVYITRQDNPYNVDVPAVQVDTVIVHRCGSVAPFVPGQGVHLKLDWDTRYQNMRNHSAAHFLYLAVREVYGRSGQAPSTKGCYIHDKSSRFDYYGKLDPAALGEVTDLANKWIARGLPIVMEPDQRTAEVSYWLYDNLVIPCGGTHVRSASELAPIRVRRQSQGKMVDRLYAVLADLEQRSGVPL